MKENGLIAGSWKRWGVVSAACVLVTLALCACVVTPRTKFYVLSSISDGGHRQQAVEARAGLSVGVGPVKVPEYLDRPQIVTRPNPSTLDVAEFDRWGEPMDSSVPRVLAENLSKLLGTENVTVYPWPPSNRIDYQVQVTVVRFDGTINDRVVLDARWTVLDGTGKRIEQKNTSSIREPVEGQSFESLVIAQSRALAALSGDIASTIANASHGRHNQ